VDRFGRVILKTIKTTGGWIMHEGLYESDRIDDTFAIKLSSRAGKQNTDSTEIQTKTMLPKKMGSPPAELKKIKAKLSLVYFLVNCNVH
jgi:hypothetical protein